MGQPSRLAALARALVTACALLVLLGAVGPAAAAHPLSAPANWTTSAPERASGFRPEARSAEATRLRSPIRRPRRLSKRPRPLARDAGGRRRPQARSSPCRLRRDPSPRRRRGALARPPPVHHLGGIHIALRLRSG